MVTRCACGEFAVQMPISSPSETLVRQSASSPSLYPEFPLIVLFKFPEPLLPTLEIEDTRKDYGEVRIICFGLLGGRMVVVGYTPRGADRHVFSMRKANEREQALVAPRLEI